MSRIRHILLGFGLLFSVGCNSDPLAPFEPEIDLTTDSFQLQATGVVDVTATLTYDWENTGTLANVDHSTTTASGTARITVRDATGSLVYDAPLVPSLNEQTASGASGTWTIRLALSDYSGTLNFRLQKP